MLFKKPAEVIFTVMKLRRRVLNRDPFANSLLSPFNYFQNLVVDRLVLLALVLRHRAKDLKKLGHTAHQRESVIFIRDPVYNTTCKQW